MIAFLSGQHFTQDPAGVQHHLAPLLCTGPPHLLHRRKLGRQLGGQRNECPIPQWKHGLTLGQTVQPVDEELLVIGHQRKLPSWGARATSRILAGLVISLAHQSRHDVRRASRPSNEAQREGVRRDDTQAAQECVREFSSPLITQTIADGGPLLKLSAGVIRQLVELINQT